MNKFKYVVRVFYDCRLGNRGDIISRHKSYDAAAKAVRKNGFASFLEIKDIRELR